MLVLGFHVYDVPCLAVTLFGSNQHPLLVKEIMLAC